MDEQNTSLQAAPKLTAVQLLDSMTNQARTQEYVEPDDQRYFERNTWIKDEAIRARILIERAIVRRAVQDIVNAGYKVRVHDGESWATALQTDLDKVMDEVGECDEEKLYVWEPSQEQGKDGKYVGSIYLVYGNDGWAVLCDYTASERMEGLLAGANELAEALGDLL